MYHSELNIINNMSVHKCFKNFDYNFPNINCGLHGKLNNLMRRLLKINTEFPCKRKNYNYLQ